MKKRLIQTMVWIAVILAFAVLCVVYYQNSRTIFNKNTFQGNTTGNLNNKGHFCEFNGTIYFANPYDNDCLYQMSSYCTGIKKVNNDCVESINVDENYIYYMRKGIVADKASTALSGRIYGVIRTKKDGTKAQLLYDGPAGVLNLYGNYIYYQHYSNSTAFSFYRVRIDGEENEKLSSNGVYPSSAYGNHIYFSNLPEDHSIYQFDINSKSLSRYMDANAYLVDVKDNYVYYIDIGNNYRLVRVNKATLEKEAVSPSGKGRCIYYNIYNDKIYYYLEGEHPGLYRMNIDKTNDELVYEGTIRYVNCTSIYTFFQPYGSTELFRVPTSGELIVEQIVLR